MRKTGLSSQWWRAMCWASNSSTVRFTQGTASFPRGITSRWGWRWSWLVGGYVVLDMIMKGCDFGRICEDETRGGDVFDMIMKGCGFVIIYEDETNPMFLEITLMTNE